MYIKDEDYNVIKKYIKNVKEYIELSKLNRELFIKALKINMMYECYNNKKSELSEPCFSYYDIIKIIDRLLKPRKEK